MTTKTCSKCGEAKATEMFHTRSTRCKACKKLYNAEYYLLNKAKITAKVSEYAKQNKPIKTIQHAAWRERNKGKVKAYAAKSKAQFPDLYRKRAAKRTAKWANANPLKQKQMRTQRVKDVTKSYISALLHLPVSEIPKDLIELKRKQLLMVRFSKQLKKEIQNV